MLRKTKLCLNYAFEEGTFMVIFSNIEIAFIWHNGAPPQSFLLRNFLSDLIVPVIFPSQKWNFNKVIAMRKMFGNTFWTFIKVNSSIKFSVQNFIRVSLFIYVCDWLSWLLWNSKILCYLTDTLMVVSLFLDIRIYFMWLV